MALSYEYTKERRNFGKQPMFCEMGPLMCDNIPVNMAERRAYILRNPVHQLTQHTPVFSRHTINTIRAEYTTTGINHAEGGWPKDVNCLDIEQTQRYRRKIEKDDPYIHCVMTASKAMEHYVLQNNAIEMYETYYASMLKAMPIERIGCRTVNVYREPSSPKRPVCAICWQPEGGHKFAVAHHNVDFNRKPKGGSSLVSFIWDVENANYPEISLLPPCPLLDLQFNSRDINMLAGALMDGRVCLWDLRASAEPHSLCAPHVAHRDMVRSVVFINSKSGQEFFSGSADGSIKWWDARNMSDYTDLVILDVLKSSYEQQSMAKASGVSVLEFEATIPSRFLVATEDGNIIGGNRKGKTPMEKLPYKFPAHLGPIWSTERNPGFLKNFLTVGDWTVRVWSEDCRESAVIWSPPHRHRITCGTWSPTRLSLMFVAQFDGVLAIWDLLRKQYEPVLTTRVCEEPLLRLKAHEQGHFLAVGSSKGNIYMQEVTASLAMSDARDKVLMTHLLERESKRERILEARMREIRLKQRQAEEGGVEIEELDAAAEAAIGDKDLLEATTSYFQQVKKEQAALT